MSPALWHIINWKDYIDGPFESFEEALAEAMYLGRDTRRNPQVKRMAKDFYQYRAPYDREEKWWPTFWLCTEEAALRRGIPETRFQVAQGEAA